MTIWLNKDNLNVKFGRDEANKVLGAEYSVMDGRHIYEFDLPYTEVQSTSAVVIGSVGNPGAIGIVLPKGLYIDEVDVEATTAFQSSGTIGSSTLSIGMVKMDRSTTYDVDGLTTTSFVGSTIDTAGETTKITVGTTGYGSAIGTTLTEDVILTALNSQHASHPFTTAGVAKVRVIGHF